MHVRFEVLAVNAIAGRGSRSKLSLPINSAAICCESAALPPLPARRTFPLLWKVFIKNCEASSKESVNSALTTESELTLSELEDYC